MSYYNVYSDESFTSFASKDEADYADNIAWWEDSGYTMTRVSRYGCFSKEEFDKLMNKRMNLFDSFLEAKKTNPQKAAEFLEQYSRFWLDHRNIDR